MTRDERSYFVILIFTIKRFDTEEIVIYVQPYDVNARICVLVKTNQLQKYL